MLERFRVWIALLYLFANSLFGFALVLFPALVFISPLSLNLFYKWVDFSMSLWLRNTVFVLENVWNINIYCYTKSASREKSPVAYRQDDKLQLVISNHATNFDWMYLWSWLAQIGKLKHVRNILKNELKCIPGFGWAMQCAAFIFLERNWTFDKDTILNMLQIFRIIKNQSVIVLFPEGTNLCARSKEKSNAYAAAHALDRYEYCLHPRTTGFNAILLELIKKDGLRYITDVTIAYKGKYPVDPADLLMRGVLPEEIYILYKIHAVDHVYSEEDSEKFLFDLWNEKEKTLKRFHKYGRFDDDAILLPSRSWYNRAKILCFLFWLTNTIFSLILLYRSFAFKIYFISVIVSTLIMSRLFGITELLWHY